MDAQIFKCPSCNAPLAPGKMARQAVCAFCGTMVQLDPSAISVKRYKEAYAAWTSPEANGFGRTVALGESRWVQGEQVAAGEISDVFEGLRARWPTERVLIKRARAKKDGAQLEREWEVLGRLQRSEAAGAEVFSARIPQPVAMGRNGDAPALAVRRIPGFRHTFAAVREAYPQGVDPHAAVWMWRRILEVLSFVHASGMAHGALLPEHLVVEDGEHGVQVVGFRCAGAAGEELCGVTAAREDLYPRWFLAKRRLSARADLAMSAQCIAHVLVPDRPEVPEELAELVWEVAGAREGDPLGDAWALHERVGKLAKILFGPPSFHPLSMPR